MDPEDEIHGMEILEGLRIQELRPMLLIFR